MAIPNNYDERVYAGWLGKCIGVRFGAPLENWTYQEIRDHLGELKGYLPLPPGKIFKPDDDTAVPVILLHALKDYGPEVTAEQLGDAWLNYLGDQRNTLWWGGFGISTEQTAYMNLQNGIPAPQSGSAALNGTVLAEQIGGQIFSDIWGLVFPNDPQRAAAYAAKAASVSHDGAGIHGGMFIAALVSAAFEEPSPEELINMAIKTIPVQSEYAQMVNAVIDFYHNNPDDWHAAYQFIAEKYGNYPGIVHIIPNAAVIVMALLYSMGDFSRAIQIANMAGWDTDCNVGNVGAIMGTAVGLKGIDHSWREPINEPWVGASLIGVRNLSDPAATASLITSLGREIAGADTSPDIPRYPFDLPGATHGFQARSHLGTVVALRQLEDQGKSALQVTIRKLKKKGEARVFVPTYLRPERLSSNYYGASFSPKIYPGQMLTADVYLPADAPDQLEAGLYAWDDNLDQGHHAIGSALTPGEWHRLQFPIPALNGICFSEAGIVFRNLGQPWSGSALISNLDWGGGPDFSFDFSKERHEYDGVSQWTFLRGYWRLEKGAYHGSGVGINESYTGDIDWKDHTLTVRMRPLQGEYHLILGRVQGALRSYALGLTPEGLALYKNEHGYRKTESSPFDWQHNQCYDLHLEIRGNTLTGWVGSGPRLKWTDSDAPYLNGQIGVANFSGCHTRFESVACKA
ncbi:MAG: ADP-ribosylglycohydrolase family protein [Chloroflexota bacterium]